MNIITIIFTVAAVLTLLLPVRIFSYMTFVIYPLLIILIVYSLVSSLRGILKKNRVDYIYFTTFAFLSLAVIHDVRISLGRKAVFSEYILTYVIILFVFIQAVLLLYKWVRAFYEKEKLQKELEYMNRNLEIIVKNEHRKLMPEGMKLKIRILKLLLRIRSCRRPFSLKTRFSQLLHTISEVLS